MKQKIIVGALEFCSLPELEIKELHMRIDTGAKTSSLHVDGIEEQLIEGVKWVSFDIHPNYHDVKKIVRRKAKVKAVRKVKTSNDVSEKRYVIETQIKIAEQCWSIELTLTDRSNMTYLMLLGREAMVGRLMVDPEKEYILSKGE